MNSRTVTRKRVPLYDQQNMLLKRGDLFVLTDVFKVLTCFISSAPGTIRETHAKPGSIRQCRFQDQSRCLRLLRVSTVCDYRCQVTSIFSHDVVAPLLKRNSSSCIVNKNLGGLEYFHMIQFQYRIKRSGTVILTRGSVTVDRSGSQPYASIRQGTLIVERMVVRHPQCEDFVRPWEELHRPSLTERSSGLATDSPPSH